LKKKKTTKTTTTTTMTTRKPLSNWGHRLRAGLHVERCSPVSAVPLALE
jgi:hypothetical protein